MERQSEQEKIPKKTEWIDEGLFFQGESPPEGEAWSERDWLEIPHEHYIPMSKPLLWQVLKKELSTESSKESFTHFIKLLEALYHFHYHRMLNELKGDYEFFAPEHGEKLRIGVSEEELLWREKRFLSNFFEAMSLGNFLPFGANDRKRALEQNYLFDLDLDVDWSAHDNEMLQRFLSYADGDEGQGFREKLGVKTSLSEYMDMPKEFDDSVILFYRGMGRDQASGRFVMQKIDIFLSKFLGLMIWPFQRLINKLRGLAPKKMTEATLLPAVLGDALDEAMSFVGLGPQKNEKEDTEEEEVAGTIFERRWIRRVNLRNQKLKLKELFDISELQEPALDRILCIFRLNPPKSSQIIDNVPILKKIVEKMVAKKEKGKYDWNIYLKMFKQIPLADSEIVFPEKKIRMKSFDLTILYLTGFLGIFLLSSHLLSKSASSTTVIITLTIVITYLVKLVLGYFRAKNKYMTRIMQELYHKSIDNDLGVLQFLVDSLEGQEVKEAALAYFFLWKAGRPMNQKELNHKIEEFLLNKFDGVTVDFEIDDALRKVIEKDNTSPCHREIPIVKALPNAGPNKETLYEAKPLDEALRIMDKMWDNFYDYNSR